MALLKPLTASPILAHDFQSLSLFRIVFAAILLVDYQNNIRPYYSDFFSESGVLPLAVMESDGKLQVEAAISRVLEFLRLYHIVPIIYPIALIAMLIGYRARWAITIVLVANIYLFWRNIYTTSGGDELARLLLIWCLFLPMNRYWSLDAALDPQPSDRPYPTLPFLALRLQIICLYFFAALFKIAGPRWLDGSAIAMALSDNVYGGTPIGLFFVSHFSELLQALTYATIAFQLMLPVLIYWPWRTNVPRTLGIGGAVLMHGSFVVFLNIGMLPYLSLAMVILLVPDEWWNAFLRRRRGQLARVQSRLGTMARRLLQVRTDEPIGLVAQVTCGLLAILAVVANVWTVRAPAFGRDEAAAGRSRIDVLEALQIGQQWSLFAPQPVSQQRDIQVRGQQADGSFIDAMTIMRRPPIQRYDGRHTLTFASPRWQKYFGHLHHLTPDQWSALGAYFCRQASGATTAGQIVRAIEIISQVRPAADSLGTGDEPAANHREDCEPPGDTKPAAARPKNSQITFGN